MNVVVSCYDVGLSMIVSTKYFSFESLFILSGTYLLLNAASYDGEILHARAWVTVEV